MQGKYEEYKLCAKTAVCNQCWPYLTWCLKWPQGEIKQVETEDQLSRGMQAIFSNNQIWEKHNVLRWPTGSYEREGVYVLVSSSEQFFRAVWKTVSQALVLGKTKKAFTNLFWGWFSFSWQNTVLLNKKIIILS